MARAPFDLEYKWLVAIVFVCGMFMDIMDTTIVFVATPTLAREFHATQSSIEWVVLGYLLSLAIWIPASGWIGDRIGTKKVFLFALATFTIASALCGQAHSLSELVAFRVLQGVGGGMLVPVGTAMLFRAFPPIERAKASTVLIIPTVLAPAMGPVVGGWLVTDVRIPEPMLAFRLYRERMFRNANIVLTLTYGSFAGTLFILPLFLQELRGLSALQSGLTTFPQAIGVIVSSQVVGRLYHRVG